MSIAEQLARDGFAIVRGLVPSEELARVRASIERGLQQQASELVSAGKIPPEVESQAASFETGLLALMELGVSLPIPTVIGNALRPGVSEALDDLRRNRSIVRWASEIVGSPLVSTPQYAVRGHCPGRFDHCYPWHQDVYFLDIEDKERHQVVNFWIPLTLIDAQAGGIELIAGSHAHGVLEHERTRSAVGAPRFAAVKPRSLPAGEIIVPELMVGDVLVMMDKTVHRSRPHKSGRIRWSLDVRYARAEQPLGRSGEPLFVTAD